MPSYNLAAPELQIIVSWLFEAEGYLDIRSSTGLSAREALAVDATLDVTEWIRTSTKPEGIPDSWWTGCALIWWVWKNDAKNVAPGKRPTDTPKFLLLLNRWMDKLALELAEITVEMRNCTLAGGETAMYVSDGKGGRIITPGPGPLRRYLVSSGHYAVCDPRPIVIADEAGLQIDSILPGDHLASQQNIINKVRSVLS